MFNEIKNLDSGISYDRYKYLEDKHIDWLIQEVERLRGEISFIANVDLITNAYDIEHVSVSVKSWAINALEGINHDGISMKEQ